uniref:Reverse transcriptase domain-containing protein n=1 Tax=Tanacetum cinerariifolium TaxID=118510 RepID=A0A699IKM0_TANCI|nr:reverse transcriptase domain-containing protein [Tanacetum cinerariifolium]
MHTGPRSTVAKALRSRYYWPTMYTDARKLIRECSSCQVHRPVPRNLQQDLTPITSLWPFYKWGIDIAGPFPEGLGEIISDNGKQFRDNPFKDWCEKLCICQCFAFVKHPQASGLIERANKSLVINSNGREGACRGKGSGEGRCGDSGSRDAGGGCRSPIPGASVMDNQAHRAPRLMLLSPQHAGFGDLKLKYKIMSPKTVDHTFGAPQDALKDQGYFDSGCSRHMTGNISYLTDFKEHDKGYVAFGRGAKGGKITGKGTIRTECFVQSPNFKLPVESQVLLKVPRKNNMYSFDMKNIVSKKDLTCLLAKATNNESMLWHRGLVFLALPTATALNFSRLRHASRFYISVAVVPNLPMVTSLVSATPEHKSCAPADSITGLNVCTIGALKRFVISSDSSHHSSTHASEAEGDSFIRSDVVPPVTTETVVTSHAADIPPVPKMGVKVTSPVRASLF